MTKKKIKKEDWEAKAEEYLAGWKRAQADFINYKNDESRRVQDVVKFANEGLLIEIIDILDNLDRVLAEVPEPVKKRGVDWLEGLEATRKQFGNLLARYGVERIRVDGAEFDPLLHEAIGGSEGEKIEEVRAGYIMHGKVIRPARVIIKK